MNAETPILTAQLQSMIERTAGQIWSRYCSQGGTAQLDRDDLTHIGIIGALEAVERFDPKKGAWTAFAKFRASGAMLDKIRKMALIRVGQDGYGKIKKLDDARRDLASNSIIATATNLAEHLGWSEKDVNKWSALRPVLVPVADSSFSEEDETYAGVILTAGDIGPEQETLRQEMMHIVKTCLENLPSEDIRFVLLSRVLHDIKLKDLAASFSCSKQSILNKQRKASDWMKHCIVSKGWPEDGWEKMLEKGEVR